MVTLINPANQAPGVQTSHILCVCVGGGGGGWMGGGGGGYQLFIENYIAKTNK